MGRRRGPCIRKKRVYSPYLGRNVMRCASYGGSGLGGLMGLGGKFPIDIAQVKDTLITGGVAVSGAVAARKGAAYLIGLYDKVDDPKPWSPGTKIWVTRLLEVGGGLALGVAVAKYFNQQDYGAAIAVGPVVLNGFDILMDVLEDIGEGGNNESTEGLVYDPALGGWVNPAALGAGGEVGVMVDQENWVPRSMFRPELAGNSWTM